MKLVDAVLLGALGVLAWSQWQEWRLNRDDAIDIPYHGVPHRQPVAMRFADKGDGRAGRTGERREVRIQGRGIGRDGYTSAQDVATGGLFTAD
ncbi:hypothetical protein ACET70_13065 [Aeromonas caviae]|uniref:hypothetical protein n=1 Tax=Aeromonas caviae TaxID=648 RepID=UPI0038D208D1